MFITCQECNTTYRLDEKALKPTGSKVRCSQCGHLFVAVPVTTEAAATPVQAPAPHAIPTPEKEQPAGTSPSAEGKALGGIDLAELDALVQEGGRDSGGAEDAAAVEDTADLDDTDLDIDFDAAIESVEADAEDESDIGDPGPEDIELDMDFEIDDALVAEDGLEGLDSETAGEDAAAANDAAEEVGAGADPSLEDDLESVLDGLEMDSYEPVETAEAQSQSGGPAAEDDLGLDDLDFDLESEDLAGEDDGLASDLSLDEDLDLSLDESEQNSEIVDSAADELNLDLDLDLEDGSAEAEPDVEDMELSLDDDFDLELDEAPAGEAADRKGAADDEEDLDLAGLDTILGTGDEVDQGDSDLSLDDELDLELEEEPTADQADQKGDAGDDDELDLNGLDTLLGIGDEMEDAESELSLGDDIDLQDDLELSLDEAPAKGTAGAKEDDVDLAGLDNLLDVEEEEAEEKASSDSEEPELELDELDLELDSEISQGAAADASDTADEELEELDFELDAEFEDEAASEEISMEEDDEVDLSDIEQMLGGDEKPVLPKVPAKMPEQAPGLRGAAEIDLTEIESAIDDAELTEMDDADLEEEPELALDTNFDKVRSEAPAGPEDLVLERDADGKAGDAEDELELELELESESPQGGDDALELESELDLSDLGDITEEAGAETKPDGAINSGDIELEFQIEEDEALEPSATFSNTTSGPAKAPASPGDIPIDQTMETLAVEESAAPQPKPFKSKKKSNKSLVLAILLILLAAIGGALYYAAVYKGIEIPFVSEYLNPQPKDPNGTMRLSTLDINSNFVENSQAGRLFVITGKVRNGYSMARSGIRLRGRLFTKGKSVAKTEFSYAGVVISDQELASLPIKVIKQRLSTEPNPQQPHGIVRPGQNVSFMVVFSDLPSIEELDEFAVELVSSKPAP